MAELKYTPEKTGQTIVNKKGDVYYITFSAFEAFEGLTCVFSTRLGGISRGQFAAMNLGRAELDRKENVLKNFEIFSCAVGINPENIVLSDQKHTDNIRLAKRSDIGKGLYRPKDHEAVDGFITNEKEVAICLLFADCVPVFLYDPENKVIGLVHSGWKGTALNISLKAVRMMEENFNSCPKNIVSVIGPSICADCYEVSADLYEAFSASFTQAELGLIFRKKPQEKYQLDLWRANRMILEKAGLKDENIHTTDLCTSCNSDFLFSHRALRGKRGNLAGIMMLK